MSFYPSNLFYVPFLTRSMRMCSWGGLGTAKTMGMVRDALIYHHFYPKNPVIANINLFGIDTFKPLTSSKQLFDINYECFLGLDEWWIEADSRKSMTLMNDVASMIMIRSRKKRWWVHMTEQHWRQLDLRIRYVTEMWYEPNYSDLTQVVNYDVLSREGTKLHTGSYWGGQFYDFYDSEEDPLTLDIRELKDQYEAYLERRHRRF